MRRKQAEGRQKGMVDGEQLKISGEREVVLSEHLVWETSYGHGKEPNG